MDSLGDPGGMVAFVAESLMSMLQAMTKEDRGNQKEKPEEIKTARQVGKVWAFRLRIKLASRGHACRLIDHFSSSVTYTTDSVNISSARALR